MDKNMVSPFLTHSVVCKWLQLYHYKRCSLAALW